MGQWYSGLFRACFRPAAVPVVQNSRADEGQTAVSPALGAPAELQDRKAADDSKHIKKEQGHEVLEAAARTGNPSQREDDALDEESVPVELVDSRDACSHSVFTSAFSFDRSGETSVSLMPCISKPADSCCLDTYTVLDNGGAATPDVRPAAAARAAILGTKGADPASSGGRTPGTAWSGNFKTPDAEVAARFMFDGEHTVGLRNTIRRYNPMRPIMPSSTPFEERVDKELAVERAVEQRFVSGRLTNGMPATVE